WYFFPEHLQQVRVAAHAVAADPPAKSEVPESKPGTSDHVMFGGTPERNMVNLVDKDIPGNFKLDEVTKWKAQLGSRAYGGPTIGWGRIFVGTNNENPRN